MPPEDLSFRVLVADDEPSLLRLIERVIVGAGNEVVLARDGDEALEVLGADGDGFDVAILDASIAPRGAGEVARAFVKSEGDVDVVLTSGAPLEGELEGLAQEHGWAFLAKPYPPRQLLAVLDEIAARGSRAPETPQVERA
ncbi:response regulator [Myxococcota bacterium]|nr:response regulator [Myxococcota bacterium]